MSGFSVNMGPFLDANKARMITLTNTVDGDIRAMNADTKERLVELTPKDTGATAANWLLIGKKINRNTVEYKLEQNPDRPFHPTSKSRQFPAGVIMWLLVVWLNAGTQDGPNHAATPPNFFLERSMRFLAVRIAFLVKRWEGRLAKIDTQFVTQAVRG